MSGFNAAHCRTKSATASTVWLIVTTATAAATRAAAAYVSCVRLANRLTSIRIVFNANIVGIDVIGGSIVVGRVLNKSTP